MPARDEIAHTEAQVDPTVERAAERPRLITATFLLVSFATFAYFTSVGAVLPVLPPYVKGPLGRSDAAVGVVIGFFALSAILLRPLIGHVGDRHGRKYLIVVGAAGVSASIAGYAFADSLLPILALRLLGGAGEAAFYVGAASVIQDIAPDERRGEAFSYFSLALFGGLALGPLIGEGVLDASGFDAAWWVAASLAGAAALVGLSVPETLVERAEPTRRRLVHPAGVMPGVILGMHIWGLATFLSFTPLYAPEVGLSGARYLFAIHSGLVFAIRFFGAPLPDRLGPRKAARASLTLSSIGLATIALWGNSVGLYAGTLVFSVGHSLLFPALMTMAVRGAPASQRASVVGTFTAFFDASFGIGALSAGTVSDVVGYRGAFGAAAIVVAIGLALIMLFARRARRPAP